MIGQVAWIVGLAVILVLLWIMPAVLFPHPGVNDAIEFAYFGPLIFLMTLIAALLSNVGVRLWGWRVEGPVGLGVFFLGIAAAFVLSIYAFGNFSNDRFAPLFLTVLLSVPVGIAIVITGFLLRGRRRGRLLIGMARGVVAAAIVTLWLLARGATDWLQAPYGFDIYVLITVAAAAVLFMGADPMGKKLSAAS